MAPKYKLTYFNGRGIAETARYLFTYAGIEFEDIRMEIEEWPQWKPKMPFGVVPLLEYEGKQICQSIPIARYLGRKAKLSGNNEWEDLEIDSVVNTIMDLYLKVLPLYDEKDENKKKTLMDSLTKEIFPYYLSRLEAIVEKNKGYIALGRLTWADFYWAAVSPNFDWFMGGGDLLQSYPNLKALKEKVEALPAVKKWIESRPDSDF